MATLEQVERALVNAHKAGDVNAARALANEVKRQRASTPPVTPAQAQPAPEWSEVPGQAMENLGPSAKQFAVDLAQPFLHPIETAQNLYDVAKGGVQHLDVAMGGRSEEEPPTLEMQKASGVGQFFRDRYGSGEAIRRTIGTDPVGAFSDAATVLTGGGGLVAKAPATLGKVGKIAKTAGTIADPTTYITKPVGWAGRQAFGLSTGVGADSFNEVARRAGNDSAATTAMRRASPDKRPLVMAQEALTAMREDRHNQYTDNMRATGADQSNIDMRPIVQKFRDLDSSLQVKGHYKTDERALNTMYKVEDVLQEWWNDPALQNAVDFDALKQRIQSLRPDKPTDQQNRIIKVMAQAVKGEIEARVPSYKKAMRDYELMSEQIDELTDTLSLEATPDTAIRKLLSAMRNNVNTNFGRRMALIDALEEYRPGLKAELAGQNLNKWTGRGIQGALSPYAAAGALFSGNWPALGAMAMTSPRLTGEITHYASKFGPRAGNVLFQAGRINDDERLNRGQY